MSLDFRHIPPHPLLRNYIEQMWVFESDGKLPETDAKLAVPNGAVKLNIFFENGIVARMNGNNIIGKEHTATLTGLVDVPVIMDTLENKGTGTIGIEFRPSAAYLFFDLKFADVSNSIVPLTDVLGLAAKQLETIVADIAPVSGKIAAVQDFLLKQLSKKNADPIFEYCVSAITASRGAITVKDLEKKTGYSSRWLNAKFIDNIGTSPKNLASIIRFKNLYSAWLLKDTGFFAKNDFYDYYYDQSHFIKEFKRFTGFTPTSLGNSDNDFGKTLYKG